RRKLTHEPLYALTSPDKTLKPAIHAVEKNDGGVTTGGRRRRADVGKCIRRQRGALRQRLLRGLSGIRRRAVHAEDRKGTRLPVIENREVRLLQIFDWFTAGIADCDIHLNHARLRPQNDSAVLLRVKWREEQQRAPHGGAGDLHCAAPNWSG